MRYLSVCSGIESASVAWESLGWKAIGFSEIETFPCSVLAHRFPYVKNYGDMTRFKEWDINETVDLLVGGTPCQSFSVAGLRGGLTDGRGNLALTYCRILQRFKPRWFVWENVPGVLSSVSHESPDPCPPANPMDLECDGAEVDTEDEYDSEEVRDLGSILAGFHELGYGFAYRILDAQYFGVPQRRRRVFVVGYLGDWRRAASVLFEPGCVSRDTKKSRKSKQNLAGTFTARASGGSGFGTDFSVAGGLQIASPITSRPYGDRGAGEERLVTMVSSTGNVSHCLNAGGMGRQDYETETMVVAFDTTQLTHPENLSNPQPGDPCHPISAYGHPPAIAFSGRMRGDDGRGYDRPPNVTGNIAGTVDTIKPGNVAGPTIGVRRLTPLECERLQGFPDGWTFVPHRGKPAADGPRYKAIGNSMAVPVMRWIGERIQNSERNS